MRFLKQLLLILATATLCGCTIPWGDPLVAQYNVTRTYENRCNYDISICRGKCGSMSKLASTAIATCVDVSEEINNDFVTKNWRSFTMTRWEDESTCEYTFNVYSNRGGETYFTEADCLDITGHLLE